MNVALTKVGMLSHLTTDGQRTCCGRPVALDLGPYGSTQPGIEKQADGSRAQTGPDRVFSIECYRCADRIPG